ncbi:LysR family transcriptional regulator [Paenarthrobacter nicotinovorans]|uniref:LysR family transcriptional regulator n=1 Tax=Paenarthrobacter nicotinovorans TaxID=29320 RepID=UPI001664FC08|nr:LysR family transcriptional regulator [Paenarthrobacter nicotinovorans]MBP2394699.1 DNA-binding transcriptional LysR family regulator [Paenarthrobacter nicotinovorans]UKE99127.1 LysR family transcriptional regulator [Paenarthrobacter nicotinovorans]UKF03907.1 LysR family transcriptional regulator [Paenarthrobacter nicotinovorans]GGV42369.1 LysR family transcriptional regulator [Paenarthrobacter nicotinovorans]
MEMDPRRLLVLLAVARTGGVLAAADELRITPSAVSQQLTKLENEAGQALLLRTPKGSVLTPAGLAMAEAGEEIERALNVARSRMQGEAEVAGVVRVGGFTSFMRTVVIPRLPEWRVQYPQLQIQLVEDGFPALMRLFRQRQLDAVVVEQDSTTSDQRPLAAGMVEEPLLDEPWKLVVPAGSLLSTDNLDLSRLPLPWLGVEPSAANIAVLGRLRHSTGAHIETIHQYQDTLTALALVAAGEGVAIVPTLALTGVVQDQVDILDVPGLGTRHIALRRFDRRRPTSLPLDTVARLLRESAADFDTRSTS